MLKKIVLPVLFAAVLVGSYFITGSLINHNNTSPAALPFVSSSLPSVTSFTLINADTDNPVAGYESIPDGAVLNLATLPTKNLNIRANTTGSNVKSVKFSMDSGSIVTYENTAPFAMFGDASGNYAAWTPTLGKHLMQATPFTALSGAGSAGSAKTLQFTVINVPVPSQDFTLSLVNTNTQTVYSGFASMKNGDIINLNSLPNKNLNIKLTLPASESIAKVQFDFDGVINYRTEATAPYSLAGDTKGVFNPWTPTVGSHTITVTKYAQDGAIFVPSVPRTITFRVVEPPPVTPPTTPVTPTPPVTPPVVPPVVIPEAPTVFMTAPATVESGGAISVTWSSTNATGCTASGDWSGSKSTSGSETISAGATGKSFTITCTGAGGTASKTVSITITVPPPPTIPDPVTPPTTTPDPVTPPPTPTVSGYTDISPKLDSKVIYVSSSSGNNGNDGTIGSPVQTIGKAMTMVRNGYPDQILLKKGDTFTETARNYIGSSKYVNVISGRSATDKMVIASYGVGPRPKIIPPDGDGLTLGDETKNFAIVGIHFIGKFNSNSTGINNEGVKHGGGNILIEDVKSEKFMKGVSFSAWVAATDDLKNPTQEQVMKNIVIRRSVIVDNYNADLTNTRDSQGIYCFGVDGLLIEDNILDNNGRNAAGLNGTVFTHNIYINAINWNVTVKNNVLANGGNFGLQLRAGGIAENNFMYKNPSHMSVGLVNGAGPSKRGGVTAIVKNNVMIGTNTTNTPLEDSSGHRTGVLHLENRGLGIQMANIKEAVISDNIIAFNTTSLPALFMQPGTGTYSYLGHGLHGLTIKDNIIYNWPKSLMISKYSLSGTGSTSASIVTFKHNYFSGLVQLSPIFNFEDGKVNPPLNVASDLSSDFDAFLIEARNQSKDNWRSEYTAQAANAYVRARLSI